MNMINASSTTTQIAELEASSQSCQYCEGLKTQCNEWYEKWVIAEAARVNVIANIKHVQEALRDCMGHVEEDNLTTQTKHRNWQAVLDGKPWKRANVEVSR